MRKNRSVRKLRNKKRMRGGQVTGNGNSNEFTTVTTSENVSGNVSGNGNGNRNVSGNTASSNTSTQPTQSSWLDGFKNLFGNTTKNIKDQKDKLQDQLTITKLKADKAIGDLQDSVETSTDQAKGWFSGLFGGSRKSRKHGRRHNKTKKPKRHSRKTHRKQRKH